MPCSPCSFKPVFFHQPRVPFPDVTFVYRDAGAVVAEVAAAPAIGEPMDINTAVQMVLKKALAHDGLSRGLHEACRCVRRQHISTSSCLQLTAHDHPCFSIAWRGLRWACYVARISATDLIMEASSVECKVRHTMFPGSTNQRAFPSGYNMWATLCRTSVY